MANAALCITKRIGAVYLHRMSDAGYHVMVMPAIETVSVIDERELHSVLASSDLLVISSMTTVGLLDQARTIALVAGRDVAVVGQRTAAACTRLGMRVVAQADTMNHLTLALRSEKQPVTHLVGRRGAERGLTVPDARLVIMYDTYLQHPTLPYAVSGTLFFSPSGVDSLMDVNATEQLGQCYAIGPTTATALRRRGAKPMIGHTTGGTEQFVHHVLSHLRMTTHGQ